MVFALAFDERYSQMAVAVINALNFYHNTPTIVVFSDDVTGSSATRIRSVHKNVTFIPFERYALHYGEWHPLIWAKIEAFRLPVNDCVMFLDADVIIYNNLSRFEDEFLASGKIIGASRDFAPLVKQFNSGFDFRQFFFRHYFANDEYLHAAAFNAGALIFRPDSSAYSELITLGKRHHEITFYPEQAILNLFARLCDGWLELPDLSVMPFSSRVLEVQPSFGLLHFFTPRPNVMLPAIARQGEPTLDDMRAWFENRFSTPYPLEKLERDFLVRRHNGFYGIPTSPDREC
jgi:lipopolysaccharide biosynthesis glycosyltransferase